jgi:hypothetical protein
MLRQRLVPLVQRLSRVDGVAHGLADEDEQG